jgi:uncharacterized protein (DUF58 family)
MRLFSVHRETIVRSLIAVVGLAMAFAAAVLSSAARETGNLLATAILASAALLLSAVVAIATVPYLAKRAVAERVRDALDYQITKEGLVYLGFVLVIAIAALNTGNNLLFLIVSALLAAVAVSGVASAAELRALDLTANIPEHAFAKKPCPAHLTVRNHSHWLPAFSIAVVSPRQKESKQVWHWQPTRFEFPRAAAGRRPWVRWRDLKLQRILKTEPPSILRQPLYFPYIGPRGSAGAELALFFERRGRYVQNAFGLSTRFPFSFLIKTRKVVLNRELIVYPEIEQTEEFYEMLPLITGEFENHIRGRGHDLYRIRDYQPDDSARHVDWKLSAKTGVLKIREFAREDEHRLRIVFDNASPGLASAERYERGVSLGASLAYYLAEQSASLTFAAQGLFEPTLWGFLHHLALVEPADDPSILDSLSLGADFNLVLTWRPRGTIVTSVWQSSYVVFLNS